MDKACKTPVEDLLRSIPADLVIQYETDSGGFKMGHNCPIGRHAHEAVAKIRSLEQQAEELSADNANLRMLALLQHGNEEHYLYGDDGEMHCNTCRCDFKTDPAMTLRNKISAYNLLKYARSQGVTPFPPADQGQKEGAE